MLELSLFFAQFFAFAQQLPFMCLMSCGPLGLRCLTLLRQLAFALFQPLTSSSELATFRFQFVTVGIASPFRALGFLPLLKELRRFELVEFLLAPSDLLERVGDVAFLLARLSARSSETALHLLIEELLPQSFEGLQFTLIFGLDDALSLTLLVPFSQQLLLRAPLLFDTLPQLAFPLMEQFQPAAFCLDLFRHLPLFQPLTRSRLHTA